MPVTAGSLSIARRINTGDYSHKEAKIELHYIAEGDEDIKVLGAQAAHTAFVQLEQVLATKINHTSEIHVDALEPIGPNLGAAEPAKRHRRTKAEMQAAPAAGNLAGDVDPTTLFADPEAVSVPVDPITLGQVLPTQSADPARPALLAAMEGPSTKTAVDGAAEITDKELNNECNATMLRIKNKTKIQSVIGEHTQGAVSTIPQSARAGFMQKLQALQP